MVLFTMVHVRRAIRFVVVQRAPHPWLAAGWAGCCGLLWGRARAHAGAGAAAAGPAPAPKWRRTVTCSKCSAAGLRAEALVGDTHSETDST